MGRRSGIGRRIDNIAKWLLGFGVIVAPARFVSNSWMAWSFVSRLDRIRVNRQRGRIRTGEMPQHVSIIMDGNRRFAWNLSLGRELGHKHGKEKLKEVMDWILELGIPYLTVYALSTENITSRDPEELESLYDLYVTGLQEISEDPRIHSKKVKVSAAGRIESLPDRVREAISYAEERTASYSDFTFTVCLAYGGREEIVDAVKEIAKDHASGDLDLDAIDNSEISSRLYDAQIPDPDLVIRTSGEERVSNFLLWQIAYSEFYFTDVHWPSFSKGDLYDAIETYQIRRRRFGG
ncbi:MAG: polyprenyl diphosphate synthase [Candidatus Thalassarchaeaceae archaeon]|nr:polyprenyl diphosphate synthase [Candidatus Thalassarchaeaceae archaeon]MDP7003739.1 polyprenyl diphosphate synthase [Candidatus Thalassarchaeaceae archaeon]